MMLYCSVCMRVDSPVKEHTDGKFYCAACRPRELSPFDLLHDALVEHDRLFDEAEKIRIERDQLRAENARLTAKLAETAAQLQTLVGVLWPALDGMYGKDEHESHLPIELIPEDRRELFHKLLEVAGDFIQP